MLRRLRCVQIFLKNEAKVTREKDMINTTVLQYYRVVLILLILILLGAEGEKRGSMYIV